VYHATTILGLAAQPSKNLNHSHETKLKGRPTMSTCPECDAQVTVAATAHAGEIVVCPECQTELEIVSLDPVELALAPEIEEDWGE